MFQNDQVSLGAELATEPGRWPNIQQQIATEYDADDFCHPGAEVHSRELDTVLALAKDSFISRVFTPIGTTGPTVTANLHFRMTFRVA